MSTLTDMRRDMNARMFKQQRNMWIAVALVLGCLPLFYGGSDFALTVSIQIGMMIIFSLAYNMLLGQGGMLSFGMAVYFGMGGFLSMHFMNMIEADTVWLPMALLPVVGAFIGLVLGLIIGSFSTRKAGTIFAMISLGIGELVAASSLIFVKFFGGEEGVTGDRTMGPEMFGVDFASELEVYYLVAAWVFIATLLMFLFSRTPVGRMANAVRDNPERAEFVGYSQRFVRLISFAGAGLFSGLAGSLFAITYEIVTEETLNAVTSGAPLIMVMIGGAGYFIGPIIGAIFYTLLSTVLSNYTEIWLMYVGIIFVLTIMYLPAGLTGLLLMHNPIIKAKKLKRILPVYGKIALPVIGIFLGIVGLLEVGHYAHNASAGDMTMSLFFVSVDTSSYLPWIFFTGILVGGFMLAKKQAPSVAETYEEVHKEALGGGDK
ncbi:MAG: branched-chain amino acid ABC transporter permease [Alphaproteobacteria bacterium]|nr:branched-chain amino acid ABC transporter permease [Rhodospirillales bacterium]MCW9044701.1 branched-chain amino acid ABC transporter permease [Alphaproteobacteria bacterium]